MRNGYDEIVLMRMHNQLLLLNNNTQNISDLLGIQAQFYMYAKYSAKIRGIDLEKDKSIFKAWTLRGTMHVHNDNDYHIYIYRGLLSKYMKDFWEDESLVTKNRKDFFCREIIDCINKGINEKKDIISHCCNIGMNEQEQKLLFNSWGGLPRYLVETGEIVLNYSRETKYRISPKSILLDAYDAELEQLKRYIKNYGPVTIYDMMYFFKWNKKKVLEYISNIKCNCINILDKIFYYTDSAYDKVKLDGKVFVLSGFDPFIIGYEKKNSIIINENNIRDIYLLQGVIRPTLFWENRVVGVWWKSKNIVNVKFFESIPHNVKKEFCEKICRLMESDVLKCIEISE